jgi:Fe-S cluster assembly iron-binding protein IscA
MPYCNGHDFFHELEEVYKNELIYRAIVVVNIGGCEDMQYDLECYNHNVTYILSVNESIDYEKLDSRVLVMEYSLFKQFIDYMDYRYGIDNISFNLIAFAYDIPDDISNDMKSFYENIKKHNTNTIII